MHWTKRRRKALNAIEIAIAALIIIGCCILIWTGKLACRFKQEVNKWSR